MPSSWRNLTGPARLLANSATILLIASSMLAVEAGAMIVLGEARDVVVKPFVLLGYLEICAIFFSSIGIVCGLLGLIFYRPFMFISDKIYFYRAGHAREVSDRYTYFEDIPSPLRNRHSDSDEDGSPD